MQKVSYRNYLIDFHYLQLCNILFYVPSYIIKHVLSTIYNMSGRVVSDVTQTRILQSTFDAKYKRSFSIKILRIEIILNEKIE